MICYCTNVLHTYFLSKLCTDVWTLTYAYNWWWGGKERCKILPIFNDFFIKQLAFFFSFSSLLTQNTNRTNGQGTFFFFLYVRISLGYNGQFKLICIDYVVVFLINASVCWRTGYQIPYVLYVYHTYDICACIYLLLNLANLNTVESTATPKKKYYRIKIFPYELMEGHLPTPHS